MQKELSNVLRGKLIGLPFIDLLCGMVQTLTTDDPIDEQGGIIQRREPVTYDHNAASCQGKEVRTIPDSNRKCIIYFEDFGISTNGALHAQTRYASSLRLVCWMDRSRLVGDSYKEISGPAMSMIVDRIVGKIENKSIFTRLTTKVAKILPQDASIFSRYTYKEQDRQYLRPPFEFFAIDFSSDFLMNQKCLSEIPWDQQICS